MSVIASRFSGSQLLSTAVGAGGGHFWHKTTVMVHRKWSWWKLLSQAATGTLWWHCGTTCSMQRGVVLVKCIRSLIGDMPDPGFSSNTASLQAIFLPAGHMKEFEKVVCFRVL